MHSIGAISASASASTSKTHKNKNALARPNKKDMWRKLESFIDEEAGAASVECVYDQPGGPREVCDACQSNLVITEEGFATCTNADCSIIYKDTLDHSAEWRFYGADDNQMTDPTRCGMPVNPLLEQSSYGCKVMCEGASSYEMRKIRRYTEWQSMPYAEKALYDEFERIKNTASNAGIPKMIIDCALRYHKKISEHKTFRGQNRDGIISASIYISCRMNDCPRTPKEIATIFHLNNKSATKGCKHALAIINELECKLENSEKTKFEKTNPNAFIERYCSPLNMNMEITKLCIFVAMCIEQNNLIPENTPHAIAAGIIYFVAQVCNLNITKKDVNRISQISEVTINKCFKKLDTIKTQLIPPSIVQKYSVAS
jgi:transcription initiation factor TFIIB